MAQQREVEWQLAAPDLSAVRRWLAAHASLADLEIEPRDSIQLHDTYLDTLDWRFHRAGFALRARASKAGREATLKSLRSARDDAADRIELSEPLAGGDAESVGRAGGDVGRRVRAVTGSEPLRPLFEVHTARERFAVKRAGTAIGEIALDDTLIGSADGKPHARIRRVEVEALAQQQLEPLETLVATLRAECSLEPATDSKYLAGLGVSGLTPPEAGEAAPPSDPSMPIAELARAELRRRLAQWAAHEPGARLGDDPKQLHDLRVAGRRIDASLRLFQAYLPRRQLRARQGLKKLMRTLGRARDYDVQIGALAAAAEGLSGEERAGLDRVQAQLAADRERTRAAMLRQLDSPAGQRWRQALQAFLAGEYRPARHAQRLPAGVAAPALIRKRFRKLRRAVRSLTDASSMEDYHHVRRLAKRLRYAIDSCAALYGSSAEEQIKATRRLQNRLGEQQDAHIANLRLTELAHARRPRLPPATIFVLGRLAERERSRAMDARERFAPAWRKVRGKRWKRLRRTMKAASKEFDCPAAATKAADEAARKG